MSDAKPAKTRWGWPVAFALSLLYTVRDAPRNYVRSIVTEEIAPVTSAERAITLRDMQSMWNNLHGRLVKLEKLPE